MMIWQAIALSGSAGALMMAFSNSMDMMLSLDHEQITGGV
jgi:hypothetical protein